MCVFEKPNEMLIDLICSAKICVENLNIKVQWKIRRPQKQIKNEGKKEIERGTKQMRPK